MRQYNLSKVLYTISIDPEKGTYFMGINLGRNLNKSIFLKCKEYKMCYLDKSNSWSCMVDIFFIDSASIHNMKKDIEKHTVQFLSWYCKSELDPRCKNCN